MTLIAALPLCAATNSEREEDLLILSPPHGELPPTFWERYGIWIILAAVVSLAFATVAAWLLLRPKPPVLVPIEIQARQALETLRQQNETGKTLSQVSRVLRRYVVAAFEMPPDELTTSEFCRALLGNETIGPKLASAVGEFLRRCDELKFAPPTSPTQIGAATCALEIVELGEARRAQLRQVAAAAATTLPVQRA